MLFKFQPPKYNINEGVRGHIFIFLFLNLPTAGLSEVRPLDPAAMRSPLGPGYTAGWWVGLGGTVPGFISHLQVRLARSPGQNWPLQAGAERSLRTGSSGGCPRGSDESDAGRGQLWGFPRLLGDWVPSYRTLGRVASLQSRQGLWNYGLLRGLSKVGFLVKTKHKYQN